MSEQERTQVEPGRWVKVAGFEYEEEEVFHIVPERAADILENKIPVSNRLARALLGAQVGDTVKYASPAGTVELTVVEIGEP